MEIFAAHLNTKKIKQQKKYWKNYKKRKHTMNEQKKVKQKENI